MEEGQPRYSTEISDEYRFKYKQKIPRTPGLFYGDDREVIFKTMNALTYGAITVLVGATYGVTAGLVAKVRGKSDGWNHLCAGLVSGQVLGSFYKSVLIARWFSATFATLGFFIKEFADNDRFITDIGPANLPFLNFSELSLFTKRPPREGVKDSS
ncbi:unnamed protein product [Candidula unifasciata]|uniref:NADH-ubiquinone oxidoreductase subunit B14.7 n=1 Tax=Candidula unifasciata TaxID=100452 RepID=A0A8S3YZF5_9EUPU|nr:unnamed protein product [Candidula unifasciata]